MKDKNIVDPKLYSKEYFSSDNDGFREYFEGLTGSIHPKFRLALKHGKPKKGEAVLDVGCGRGELVYYCAQLGARALGIDYSKDGIDMAKDLLRKLPEDARGLADARVGDAADFPLNDKYDLVFMIEVTEHMHDWQLKAAFGKIYEAVKKGGRLIITTPNYYYEKYLCPLKRVVNIPFNLIKLPLRIMRGKYKARDIMPGLKKIFRIWPDRGELNRLMHVNVTTPAKLKKMLKMFDVKIICEDPSKNILSRLAGRWFGRNVVIIARKLPS